MTFMYVSYLSHRAQELAVLTATPFRRLLRSGLLLPFQPRSSSRSSGPPSKICGGLVLPIKTGGLQGADWLPCAESPDCDWKAPTSANFRLGRIQPDRSADLSCARMEAGGSFIGRSSWTSTTGESAFVSRGSFELSKLQTSDISSIRSTSAVHLTNLVKS